MQHTSKEGRYPFGGVIAPKQNALALANASSLQLAGKAKSQLRHLEIAPGDGAISPAMDKGNFPAALQIDPAKIGKRVHRSSKLTSLKRSAKQVQKNQ